MTNFIDLTGQRFGRLTVVSRAESGKSRSARWNCVCDCGVKITVRGDGLRSGRTKSCGCLHREITRTVNSKHGMWGTPTYKTWAGMVQRCTNSKNPAYKNYGGRDISVCERWDNFENFYADMGERPKGFSVERKDNNGNYSPENCVYATSKEQQRNTRKNRIIKYDGRWQCMSAWAEELGIDYDTLQRRLKHYPPQFAFNM